MAQVQTKTNPPRGASGTGSNSTAVLTGKNRQAQSRTAADQKQAFRRAPTDVLAARLYYAELFGWVSFPVPPNTKKSYKSGKNGNGRRWGATNKPSVIERDFRYWPEANLGIQPAMRTASGCWRLTRRRGMTLMALRRCASSNASMGGCRRP